MNHGHSFLGFKMANSDLTRHLIRLSVPDFEDLEKSTVAYVFFRIANPNNDYPIHEF